MVLPFFRHTVVPDLFSLSLAVVDLAPLILLPNRWLERWWRRGLRPEGYLGMDPGTLYCPESAINGEAACSIVTWFRARQQVCTIPENRRQTTKRGYRSTKCSHLIPLGVFERPTMRR